MNIEKILSKLTEVKRLKDRVYQAKCPCHDDKRASLSIKEANDKILIYCHAGCDAKDIVGKLGLKMSDLFNEGSFNCSNSWQNNIKNLEAVYDYGEYMKIRLKGKMIFYGSVKNNEFIKGMPEGVKKCLYHGEQIKKAISKNKPIFITEGEKDCDNMIKRGFCCTTAGGVKDWTKEFAQYFKGAKVIILPDNDKAGQALEKNIASDLRNIAFSVLSVKTSAREKGDVSDYFEEGYNENDLKRKIENEQENTRYADWVIKNKNGTPIKINSGILADSIGKSLKYILLKKKSIDIADFYVYESGVYEKKSRMEFKGFIKNYVPIRYQTDTLLNNVYGLMMASDENSFDYEAANSSEGIINFKNGLYDIKNDKLTEHTDKEITTIQLKCRYDPKAKCPRWIEFINTLCSDSENNVDEQKIAVLQEWFGLLISNVNVAKTKKCLALHSSIGDTGKSRYLDILTEILGDENATHIPIQNMSDRFAMGNLYGKRINTVGDQKSDDINDSSMFKQLTGGDPIAVEMKGKTAFQFRFKGGFAFACNDLPCFKDDKGGHIFDRFTIIKCEHYLKPEERDKTLQDKLKKELDGIAMWAIEGLKRLVKNDFNFTYCESSDAAVREYRGNVDTFYKFLNENYEITLDNSDRISKTELEQNYSQWCRENDYIEIKKKNIKERAAKSGIELGKYAGDWFYKGLKEKFYNIEPASDKELPF